MTYHPPLKHITDRYRRIAVELARDRPAMLLLAQVLQRKMVARRASNKLAFGESDALELVFAIQRYLIQTLP